MATAVPLQEGQDGSRLHSPAVWAAITAATAAAAFLLVSPSTCAAVGECKAIHDAIPANLNSNIVYSLATVLLMEVAGLISTYQGVRQTVTLVPQLRSRCLPSLLLAIMFTVLIAQHSILSAAGSPWYAHTPGAQGQVGGARPVYTMTYVEWIVIVPGLLVLAGHCALGRPLRELTRPVLLTNVYIVFAWVSAVTTGEVLRWSLILVTFAMYGLASVDMLQWVANYYSEASRDLPLRTLRPCLAIGLVALFAVYGVVFLASALGTISSRAERGALLFLDVGAKLAMSACFVVIRTREYHSTVTGLVQKVSSSNVGLISILRGSFDFVLPCDVDAAGGCRLPLAAAADLSGLGSVLGRTLEGWDIGDLMPNQQERAAFQAYVANTLRQALCVGALEASTMSPDGRWLGRGAAPPIAQVLNCGLAAAGDGAPRAVQCSIHLSVVPHMALVEEQRWQVIAAVRLHQGIVQEAVELVGVEEQVVKPVEPSDGAIVASLSDVAMLGVSGLLSSETTEGSESSGASLDLAAVTRLAGGPRGGRGGSLLGSVDEDVDSERLESASTTQSSGGGGQGWKRQVSAGSTAAGTHSARSTSPPQGQVPEVRWGPMPPCKGEIRRLGAAQLHLRKQVVE